MIFKVEKISLLVMIIMVFFLKEYFGYRFELRDVIIVIMMVYKKIKEVIFLMMVKCDLIF